MHGVEAYTGSAVQLALLDAPPAVGPDDALVLVHVLEMAKHLLGKNWMADYVAKANKGGIERVLL